MISFKPQSRVGREEKDLGGHIFFNAYVGEEDVGRVTVELEAKEILVCFSRREDILKESIKAAATEQILESTLAEWEYKPEEHPYYTGIGKVIKIEPDAHETKTSTETYKHDVATVQLGEHELKFSNWDNRDYFPKKVGEEVSVHYDYDGYYILSQITDHDKKNPYRKWERTLPYWVKKGQDDKR